MSAFPLTPHHHKPAGWVLRCSLWTSQVMLSLIYLWAATVKLTKSPAELALMIPWAADHSEPFIRLIGVVDLAAGLGVVLPAMVRVWPQLTVAAGLGSALLQVCAMVFHATRGEWMVLPFNALLLGLSLYVAWGRTHRAPIASR